MSKERDEGGMARGEAVRILLVDDRPANLLALEAALQSPHHDFVTAGSGAEALRKIADEDFALVLLDVQMPAMDGFETATRVKSLARESAREVPIIFVTAIDSDARRVATAYGHGAVDFIQKPFDVDALRAKVSTFVALFRAQQRLEIERAAAKRRALEGERRLQTLTDLALGLSGAHSTGDVIEVIVEQGRRLVGADTCTLYSLDPSGPALDLLGYRGIAPEVIDKLRRITRSSDGAAKLVATLDRVPIWMEDIEAVRTSFPEMREILATERLAQAVWNMPLVVDDEPIGILAMGFHHPRPFPEEERVLVSTFARHCAQALQRVRLLERDQETRQWLAKQNVRRDFLASAGEALASSMDYRQTLSTVARLAVPQIADWCSISVVDPESGTVKQLAVAHADPAKVEFARSLGERYPADPNAPTGVPQVIRTGKAELYPEIPLHLLEAGAQDAEHLRFIHELALESAIVVPLQAHGEILGAMTFIYAQSGRHYTEEDLAFAEDFARRAAMAIENARALKDAEDSRVLEQTLRAQAESANRAKDEFLAMVSHELRTPLNAILGWTVLLRDRKPPAELARALAIIERNARAQATLIEDVLDVSRIISGKMSLAFAPTNLADVVQAAIETTTPAADAKEITLAVSVDPALPLLHGDANRLQQVVWNLLINAVKFTPRGGEVRVEARREGSDVRIMVSDNGEGIPPGVLDHLFEPFHQADASATRRHGGLGLGLAIVKHLVVAHGGVIDARSEGQGKGSVFSVRLPVRAVVPALQPEPSVQEAATASADAFDARSRPVLDRLRVLVVDDEDDVRNLVRSVLVGFGAVVDVAGSAREGLRQFAVTRPDVLVSDVGMPEMDGYAMLRQIRSLPVDQGGAVPAIALTAYASREDARRSTAAGFQAHVTKPADPIELAAAIAELGRGGAAGR